MYFGFQELLWRVVASESHYKMEQNVLVYAIRWFSDQELTVTYQHQLFASGSSSTFILPLKTPWP